MSRKLGPSPQLRRSGHVAGQREREQTRVEQRRVEEELLLLEVDDAEEVDLEAQQVELAAGSDR